MLVNFFELSEQKLFLFLAVCLCNFLLKKASLVDECLERFEFVYVCKTTDLFIDVLVDQLRLFHGFALEFALLALVLQSKSFLFSTFAFHFACKLCILI